MRKLVHTVELSKEEWLAVRRNGIGGSEAAAILGISPYTSSLKIWEQKTGRITVDSADKEFLHFGTILENIVRKEFELRTELKVRKCNYILQSENNPFMIADLDGIVKDSAGNKCIFEAKTASAYKSEVWEKGVPKEYVAQVQHYMYVTGFNKAFVACLCGGNSFYIHEVHRDEDYICNLVEKEKEFWNCVVNDVPPVVDGARSTTEYLDEKFPVSNGEIKLTEEAKSISEAYKDIDSKIKDLTIEKRSLENKLKAFLGDHETASDDEMRISWKTIIKKSLDTKKVKEFLGDGYEDYLTESSYRRFSVA